MELPIKRLGVACTIGQRQAPRSRRDQADWCEPKVARHNPASRRTGRINAPHGVDVAEVTGTALRAKESKIATCCNLSQGPAALDESTPTSLTIMVCTCSGPTASAPAVSYCRPNCTAPRQHGWENPSG